MTDSVKRVISVSLGSSARDAEAELELGQQKLIVRRIGTDGDLAKAKALMQQLDGQVDAMGLGGTDLYVYVGENCYTFRESAQLIAGVKKTPVLDGSGMKNSLERRLIQRLAESGQVSLRNKKVLLTCAVDRFGMAEAFLAAGAKVTFGDLIFSLHINKPLFSLKALGWWAKILAPVVTKLPVSFFYPMGKEQEQKDNRYQQYFLDHDVIAGDFHYIKKYMPSRMDGKIVITNTVTAKDRDELRQAGVKMLITTTPCLNGRSFGTNVMEAMLVALDGGAGPLKAERYLELLDRYDIQSSIESFS